MTTVLMGDSIEGEELYEIDEVSNYDANNKSSPFNAKSRRHSNRSMKSMSSVRHSRNRRGSTDSRFTEENLGDDFENSPWVPPSIEKARQFRAQSIIRGGVAPLDSVNACRASDLGPGVSLYFQFVKSMAICMFIMSLLSAPSIVFAYYGSAIDKTDADAMGFYRFTLGNIGYDSSSATFATDSSCEGSYINRVNTSTTCVHLFDNIELTTSQVGIILTLSEILQFVVFMTAVYYLNYRLQTLQRVMHKEDTSVCDYSVMVRGLPRNCSLDEVLVHFSTVYALNTVDWANRPPVLGAQTVQNVSDYHLCVRSMFIFES